MAGMEYPTYEEAVVRNSHLPYCYFTKTSISLTLDSPRLFIFSTSKATPVRLVPILCDARPSIDHHIQVQVICDHFVYQWESRMSTLEQSSPTWQIKPTVPCGLDPFQLKIIVSIDGEKKTLLDRFANIVCKASEFPKGLAHLLIQERNGKQATPDVFLKLKKKKSVPGIRLDLPSSWDASEQWRVIDNIWHTLDAKNATRPLCKPTGPFPILQPSRHFIENLSHNPLGQYRAVWIWIYGVLRFYTVYYSTMKNYIGRIPECIDQHTAEERLSATQQPSLLLRFGKEGEDVVCSTCENGIITHYQFFWKSKPSTKGTSLSRLPKHLSQLSENNFQYIVGYGEPVVSLEEVVNIFSVCLNQPVQSAQALAISSMNSEVLVDHCMLLSQYICEVKQNRNTISIHELELSLQQIMKQHDIQCNGILRSPNPPSPQQVHIPCSPPQQMNAHNSPSIQRRNTSNPIIPSYQPQSQQPSQSQPQPHHQQHQQPLRHPQVYGNGNVTTNGNGMGNQQPYQMQMGNIASIPPNRDYYPQQMMPPPGSYHYQNSFNAPYLDVQDDMRLSGDQFLELVKSSGPGETFFNLYPQGKKRKLNQAFDNSHY